VKLRLPEIKEIQDQFNGHMVMKKSKAGEFCKLVTNGHLTDGGRTKYDYKFHTSAPQLTIN
jgi:hypothetical protein